MLRKVSRHFAASGLLMCAPIVTSGCSFFSGQGAPAGPLNPGTCFVSAHRGDRTAGADNSANAIMSGVALGADQIEIDLRESDDGEIFLFHDRYLRTRNSHCPDALVDSDVETLTWRELQQCTIIRSSGENRGERLLLFRDALTMIQSSKSRLALDLKGDSPLAIREILRLARAAGVSGSLVIQSNAISQLRKLKRAYPEVQTIYRVSNADGVAVALRFLPDIVHVEPEQLTPETVSAIHSKKMLIQVKALGDGRDNQDTWRYLSEHGADIIMTDRAEDAVKSRDKWCPATKN